MNDIASLLFRHVDAWMDMEICNSAECKRQWLGELDISSKTFYEKQIIIESCRIALFLYSYWIAEGRIHIFSPAFVSLARFHITAIHSISSVRVSVHFPWQWVGKINIRK